MTKLIICADDYAQSTAIDAAICDLIAKGLLTATSCMTLSPHWLSSAKQLTPAIRQQADIGLHLDFTQFSHALRLPHPQLVLRSLLHLLDTQAIIHNIRQQLDAFELAMGTPPDYVDGHLHVHQLPQIRQALLAELSHRYAHLPAAQRPWLRISSPPAGSGFKARLIHCLGARALQQQAAACGFASSPVLLGVYDFQGDTADYQARWQQWADQCQGYAECAVTGLPPVLMCHPAQPASPADSSDPIAAARIVEWELMQSAAFQSWLAGVDIQPVKGSVQQTLLMKEPM